MYCDWVDHMSNFASTLCLSPLVGLGPSARPLQLLPCTKTFVKEVSCTGANVPAKHLRSRSSDRGLEINARHDAYIECFDVAPAGFYWWLAINFTYLHMFSLHWYPVRNYCDMIYKYVKKLHTDTPTHTCCDSLQEANIHQDPLYL